MTSAVYSFLIRGPLASMLAGVFWRSRRWMRIHSAAHSVAANAADALRKYVPGAVADKILRGEEVEVGERDVTVLFVDLTGYTAYAENLSPREVFSTINRYTEAVSAVVQRHGGSVVEFNGDGMMAVFGAPNSLPHKERAALAAARGVLAELRNLPMVADRPGNGRVAVGIGVASGRAFVGNIQAADRLIWSAIGSTTNLASRLQNLAKQSGLGIVTDEATWRGAGTQQKGFSIRPDTAIRGCRHPLDVYAFSLNAPGLVAEAA